MRKCSETLEPEMTPAEQAFLQQLIRDHNFTGSHLEVGTAAGGSLCNMMSCFDDASRPKFVVVDRMSYFPRQREIVAENLTRHNLPVDTVDFRTTTSSNGFKDASERDERFEFMLIDACHKIQAVMSDLRWLRQLSVNGIACFHDYSDKFPGVKLSLDRLLARYDNYERVGVADSLLAIRKTATHRSQEINFSDSAYSVAMSFPLAVNRKLKKWSRRKAA